MQTFSWIPVDVAAAAFSEILFAPEPVRLVYHLENPIRQSWQDTLDTLASGLKLDKNNRIRLDDWITAVSAAPDEGNPAKILVDFFKTEFQRMSGGDIMLSTDTTRKCVPSLRKLRAIDEDAVHRYLGYWKFTGIIN